MFRRDFDQNVEQPKPMSAFCLICETSWDRLSGVLRVMGPWGIPEVYVNSGAQVAPQVGRSYCFTQTLLVETHRTKYPANAELQLEDRKVCVQATENSRAVNFCTRRMYL